MVRRPSLRAGSSNARIRVENRRAARPAAGSASTFTFEPLLDELEARLDDHPEEADRAFITIAYAQSLDGSLTEVPGEPLMLSDFESCRMTHRLRAMHDGLLVGVDTVIADNPRLNVRLADGPDPVPIVLDSSLRIPLSANLFRGRRAVLVATTSRAAPDRIEQIRALGAKVLVLPTDAQGWVDLASLVQALMGVGIRSVMVEGGEKVLSNLLRHHLADHLVLTVSPMFVGGLHLGKSVPLGGTSRFFLDKPRCASVGRDVVIAGRFRWDEAP